MFEKCGLRDIFCGFKRSRWIILASVIIFTVIGAVLYRQDLKTYETQTKAADDREVYAGYAYYYLSGINGDILSSAEQKRYAKSYIDLMTAIPSREAIWKQLLKKHDKEELKDLLDPVLYANGVSRNLLWEGSYYVEKWSSENILRVKASAQTQEMCKELLHACRDRLEAISESTKDTALVFEGEYTKKTTAGKVVMSDAEEKETVKKPSVSRIGLWLLIGLFVGILISVILSILVPVLNRPSDFELYGVKPLGEINKKTIPLLARVLDQMIGGENRSVTFATSRKNGGKLNELLAALAVELKNLGREVCLEKEEQTEGKIMICAAVSPDQDAKASDLCAKADLVILAEEKGRSRHSRLDETKHYLKLIGIEPEGAVLIA